ncbi:glutathione hydrolase 1 proenzyme-like [Siphateles boraxobius]|uniref:glutathione hydrolase 1 proenzyme-like n=1 Tax=Siphateles boraxobius TaxID=180520 RepID=UPI0040647ECC
MGQEGLEGQEELEALKGQEGKSKRQWSCLKCGLCLGLILCIAFIVLMVLNCQKCGGHLSSSGNCYAKAAVAADAEVCSEIGRDMLKRGGSVVDAAIAALLCVSVVNPQNMGIGGGVVFTIYNASTGKVETINAKETAPMGASQDMFGNDPENAKSGLYIAVPGELRGYQMAHERHGRLPWKELFQPSIKLAEEGIRIGKALADAIKETSHTILNNTALCEVFCDSNNNTLKEKDIIRFPKLALTYKKIAEEGPDVFYNGSLTQTIVDDIKAAGYNISSSSVSTTVNKTLMYHRMIEAFRLADVEKKKLGRSENITELVKNMTSERFADDKRSEINDFKQTSYGLEDNNPVPDDHGTSHLSIIAEDGSAVAVTSSINNEFGSKVMSRSTGIIFNDQMMDFIEPEEIIKPGKWPPSSMCPTIILDQQSRKVRMVVGGAGGTNITTATAQVILNHLFFGYDLKKAVKHPRVQIRPNVTNIEDNFDEDVLKGLTQKNHHIEGNTELTAVQAVVREGDKLCAESDERNGVGRPAGY